LHEQRSRLSLPSVGRARECRLKGGTVERIEGLKYEKLSIKKLMLERAGEEDEVDEHERGKARAISRLA
jgi:hypothetical protein